jgi:dynactin complex subunit
MKAWIPLTLVFALGSAVHAQATCTYPRSPDAPPDGNTATKEQMIAAKQDTDRYNKEMNSYLDCLKLETDAVTPKDPSKLSADEKKKVEEQQKVLVQKNNAAVDELQAVVGRFNEQLKLYKAKAKS